MSSGVLPVTEIVAALHYIKHGPTSNARERAVADLLIEHLQSGEWALISRADREQALRQQSNATAAMMCLNHSDSEVRARDAQVLLCLISRHRETNQPAETKGETRMSRPLSSYRPQHDEDCTIYQCVECGAHRSDTFAHGYDKACDDFTPFSCSCGLTAALAREAIK